MKKLFSSLAVLMLAPFAFAQSADNRTVIDAAVGDWNKDGLTDLALLDSEGQLGDAIGLQIFLRDKRLNTLERVEYVPDYSYGTTAEVGGLAAMQNGSLIIQTAWAGIGRTRWSHSLTIAYRDQRFVVAGFSYGFYDSLDHDLFGDCDYNVLTGQYEVDGNRGRVQAQSISLEDWDDVVGFEVCNFG